MSKPSRLFLLAGAAGVLLTPALALGEPLGLLVSLCLAAVALFASYWFCDRLVIFLCRAREVRAGEASVLTDVVGELSARAGLPMPRIYVLDSPAPNAFATGRSPRRSAVAASSGLLAVLDREELAGVMAHELAHIKHRDGFCAFFDALFGSALSLLSHMTHRALLRVAAPADERRPLGRLCRGLVAMRLAPLAASLTEMAVCRSREYAADAEGASICGNPLWLARALRKLDPYSCSAERCGLPVSGAAHTESARRPARRARRGSSHPPLAQRIRRLEAAAFGIRW